MTASVQYWRLPEEEAVMTAYLLSLEPTVALPVRRVATPQELVWKPVDEALRGSETVFLITPARFAAEMTVHHNDQGFAPDVTSTPAVYYERGRMLDGRRLLATALSAEWDHLASDGKTVVDKPADFVRWAKNVMQWVRRVAPGWYRYKSQRITPKAEEARKAGIEMVW